MKKRKIVASIMFCFLLAVSVFFWKSEAKAAGNYVLQINKGTNVVTVFRTNGTAERAFICSTGSDTPIGTFNTSQKLRWHELMGPSWGQYCTRIVGGVLFHSVWYYRNGDYASQSYREFNKLGTTCSHGCVRLTVADAKWIYDNCPLGTTVKIIYGSSANDPLGKPAAIKVPNVREGWDPTDPHPSNPYSKKMPSIDTSRASTTIPFGSAFNPFSGIVARDSLGNDITSRMAYAGAVDTSRLGSYRITYRVTDALGRTAYADVVYTVADTQPAIISGVKKKLKKEYNSTLKVRSNVKAYNVTGTNLTKKIKVKVIYPGSSKEKTFKGKKLKLKKLGTYRINYYVTNPNNKAVTKVTCKVTVRDTKKPKLTGVSSSKTVEYNSKKNLKSGVKAKLVSGKNMTSKIVVKVKAPGKKKYTKLSASKYKKYKFTKTGTYRVEYSVANPYNKKAVAKKVTKYIVKDTKAPKISGVASKKTVEYNTTLNLTSGVTAKLVSGKSMTSKIAIKVKKPGASSFTKLSSTASKSYAFNATGVYTVEYSVANPNNAKAVGKKVMTVTVVDTKAPVIQGVRDKEAAVGECLDLRAGVTAALVSGKDITSSITVVITAPDGTAAALEGKEYTFTQAGAYTVEYSAANPEKASAVTKVGMKVVVSESQEMPELTIDSAKAATADKDVPYDVFAGVTAVVGQDAVQVTAEITGVDAAGQEILDIPEIDREGKVSFHTVGTYKIVFKAVNPDNAAMVKTVEFTLEVVEAAYPENMEESDSQSQEGTVEEAEGAKVATETANEATEGTKEAEGAEEAEGIQEAEGAEEAEGIQEAEGVGEAAKGR
ncbi:L,D-transpeptidase family protein [Lachnospiraceae bacterium 29-84]